MRTHLRLAVEQGILVGVRLGVASLVAIGIFFVGWYGVQDYTQTRVQSQQGAEAFRFLQQKIRAGELKP